MEIDDKKQFLAQSPPFDGLSDEALSLCLNDLSIEYHKAGELLDRSDAQKVLVLRTGSVEIRDQSGEFFDRMGAGDVFLFPVLGGVTPLNVSFLEDTLLYTFERRSIELLAPENARFSAFFKDGPELNLAEQRSDERDFRLNQEVSDLMVKEPLCTHESATIRQVAISMSEAKVSSILIVDEGKLTGIVTDRDLRSRVLAKGVDPDEIVASVMTPKPVSIAPAQTVYEAQMQMMKENIHHLPVVSGTRPVGIVALNDFARAQNSEPIYMIQEIHRAGNRDDIYRTSERLPNLIEKMIKANVRAEEIGRVITSITDAITRQLIFLAQRSFGAAPCAYAWVVFGSQARQDQMLGSDQDNGLILENSADGRAQDYFKRLAAFVNEGLDRSGLKYCPGDIMAMTDKWRQTLDQWQAYFTRWIREPEPKALMHASIFYDIRHVAGLNELTKSLQDFVLGEAKKNTIFLACMADIACQSSPPLGFFKQFVLEKDGNHNQVLDLKHRGTVPIVALVRLYCLANGLSAVNTMDRLTALEDAHVMTASDAKNLRDAHEFIARLRLEGQEISISEGREPSNRLDPNLVSPLVRHQLKDAFSAVAESQKTLKMRFGHGAI